VTARVCVCFFQLQNEGNQSVSKINRETKVIPALIYAIEQFEHLMCVCVCGYSVCVCGYCVWVCVGIACVCCVCVYRLGVGVCVCACVCVEHGTAIHPRVISPDL